MAELNLNFHAEEKKRRQPTKSEINQIKYLAFGVEGIIKTLGSYVNAPDDPHEACSVCMCVCNALELLMKPISDYLSNYAGDEAAKE